MDRVTVYRNQIPFETDFLLSQRWGYEALGLALLDLIGASTVVGGLECVPTAPASFSVRVMPGRIYTKAALEPTPWGVIDGTGGLAADTLADHEILKQGLMRDSVQLNLQPPENPGQSIVYLIQATFQEADGPARTTQFYNTQRPSEPITEVIPRERRDRCVLSLKPGVAAVTGNQIAPPVDAGYVPVWMITVAHETVNITAANIAQHPGAPLIEVIAGGGGSGLSDWVVANADYVASTGDRIIGKTAGGPITITLPPNPDVGATITIKGSFQANNLTVARNGKTIEGAADNLILNAPFMKAELVYDGGTWVVSR